jgi:hemoglobin
MKALLLALLLAVTPALAQDSDLYRQFGGKDGLVKLVDDVTDRWVKDPRIGDTFNDINLVRFKGLLTDQLCELVGGPCHYKGRDMYKSHKGLHLNEAEFADLAEDLQISMDKFDIPQSAQFQLMAMLAPMEKDIVTRDRFHPEPQ